MSPSYFIKTFVICAVLGYLGGIDSTEARTLDQQQALASAAESIQNEMNMILQQQQPSHRSNLDMDIEDDDEDDLQNQQNPSMASTGQNIVYNPPITAEQSQKNYNAIPSNDLKTSASHHHHGHGAKGWLDMGAWTGKKGAFGWYDKHPVGKGK